MYLCQLSSQEPLFAHPHTYTHIPTACMCTLICIKSVLPLLFFYPSLSLFKHSFRTLSIHLWGCLLGNSFDEYVRKHSVPQLTHTFFMAASNRLPHAQMKSLHRLFKIIYLNNLSTPSKKVLQYQAKKKKKKSVNVK